MPSKTTPAKAAPTIEEAEAEAAEAEGLVAALEESIRSGDGSVSSDDLTKGRAMAEFAQLQVEAAARRGEEAARRAAEADLDDIVHEARDVGQYELGELEKLRASAGDAFVAYLDALDRVSTRASKVTARLEVANLRADQFGLDRTNTFGVDLEFGDLRIATEVGSVRVPTRKPDPHGALAAVIAGSGVELPAPHIVQSHPVISRRPWPLDD